MTPEVDAWVDYEVDKISDHIREKDSVTSERDSRPRGNWDTVKDSFFHPRFQGGMQAIGGLLEACIGGTVTLGTRGSAAHLGWPIMTHGLDQFVTGARKVITGVHQDTATSHYLQKTGMSENTADLMDGGISMVGTMGGAAAIRAGQLVSLPKFDLPRNAAPIHNVVNEVSEQIYQTFKSQMSYNEALRYDKYWTKHAPEQSIPYSTWRRYTPQGDIKQVTTYDKFGNRHRQYDLIDPRRGPHQHNFEYGPEFNRPKGSRSGHLIIGE